MPRNTFAPPDSQEREYTRELVRYARSLARDVETVIIPKLSAIDAEFDAEARRDTASETLDALMAELAALAGASASLVISRLPGRFTATSAFNERQFALVVKANTGFTLPPVMPGAPRSAILGVTPFRSEPYLVPLSESWVTENTNLIKSLPTRLHPELEGIIRRGVTSGASVKQIKDEIRARYGVTESRAKLIAQDQTLKLNADLTRYRLQSVGVTEYIWRTVNDSRVRPEHVDRNGKTYSWDKPPAGGGHPGSEVRCRCRSEAVWPEDDGD